MPRDHSGHPDDITNANMSVCKKWPTEVFDDLSVIFTGLICQQMTTTQSSPHNAIHTRTNFTQSHVKRKIYCATTSLFNQAMRPPVIQAQSQKPNNTLHNHRNTITKYS